MPKSGKRAKTKNDAVRRGNEDRILSLCDELNQFEWFKETVLPALQKDLRDGADAESLRTKFHALVQAQMITTALASPDAKARLTAAKDILDRTEGTATQKIEQTHKLDKLPEAELDAMLLSAINKGALKDEDESDSDGMQH